ncbi:MAG TPA: hypothetical protein H9900_05245 [Candidatus Monoglobus merdigallinarum]|uniref:SLH domain-containing protein n=1 Tax=Candidatus Monoglobus merdigallinarum TaxID=2838698 RepID=A0A9D1PQM1_9FIRM|nr:hypothetical protein [Candidatus Monoglobus merdigallinarum]
MKKIISIIIVVVMLTSLFCVSVSAYDAIQTPGTYVGEALYTDIITYINHYAIPSWIVNGYPMVAVEDLNKYGFDTIWDSANKTLRIYRNYDKVYPDPIPVYLPANNLLGTKQCDVYASDVKVYINNYEYQIQGFSGIPGYTFIYVGDLTALGATMYFISQNKAVNIWINGMSIAEYQRPTSTKATTYNIPAATASSGGGSASSGVVYYDYIDENMPEWARATIQKLVNKGYIVGDANGRLRLTEEDLRYFVVNDRAGVYGD